jgi:hypothetical protein
MSRHEQVIVTFARMGKAHQAAAGADGIKSLIPASHQLVRIDLVPSIPNQSIATKVKGAMQSETQLDNAKIGSKVRRPLAHPPTFCATASAIRSSAESRAI